jgi:hypothetical protein
VTVRAPRPWNEAAADQGLILLGRMMESLEFGDPPRFLQAAAELRAWMGEHADPADADARAAMDAVGRLGG